MRHIFLLSLVLLTGCGRNIEPKKLEAAIAGRLDKSKWSVEVAPLRQEGTHVFSVRGSYMTLDKTQGKVQPSGPDDIDFLGNSFYVFVENSGVDKEIRVATGLTDNPILILDASDPSLPSRTGMAKGTPAESKLRALAKEFRQAVSQSVGSH